MRPAPPALSLAALLLAGCGMSAPPAPAGQVDPQSTQAAAVAAGAPRMPTPPPALTPAPVVASPKSSAESAPKRPARKPTPRPTLAYDCAEQDVSGWSDDQFAHCSGH